MKKRRKKIKLKKVDLILIFLLFCIFVVLLILDNDSLRKDNNFVPKVEVEKEEEVKRPKTYEAKVIMVGDAFLDAGFNLLSLATNHTMDKGELDVLNSVNYWKSKENVVYSGQWSSWEDRNEAHLYEINGISYAFSLILYGLMD